MIDQWCYWIPSADSWWMIDGWLTFDGRLMVNRLGATDSSDVLNLRFLMSSVMLVGNPWKMLILLITQVNKFNREPLDNSWNILATVCHWGNSQGQPQRCLVAALRCELFGGFRRLEGAQRLELMPFLTGLLQMEAHMQVWWVLLRLVSTQLVSRWFEVNLSTYCNLRENTIVGDYQKLTEIVDFQDLESRVSSSSQQGDKKSVLAKALNVHPLANWCVKLPNTWIHMVCQFWTMDMLANGDKW